MSFFSNLKKSLGHYSTWALGLAATIPTVWVQVPDEVKVLIPAKEMAIATAVVAVAGVIGKGIQQGGPTVQLPKTPDAPETADVIKAVVEQQGAKFVKDLLKKALK